MRLEAWYHLCRKKPCFWAVLTFLEEVTSSVRFPVSLELVREEGTLADCGLN